MNQTDSEPQRKTKALLGYERSAAKTREGTSHAPLRFLVDMYSPQLKCIGGLYLPLGITFLPRTQKSTKLLNQRRQAGGRADR